jgi:hypothetical protein
VVRGSWLVARGRGRNSSSPYLTTLGTIQIDYGSSGYEHEPRATNHEPRKHKGRNSAPRAASPDGALVLGCLDVDQQVDVVAEIGRVLSHAEFGPLDGSSRIRSAYVFLYELIGSALERRNGKGQRLRHAE